MLRTLVRVLVTVFGLGLVGGLAYLFSGTYLAASQQSAGQPQEITPKETSILVAGKKVKAEVKISGKVLSSQDNLPVKDASVTVKLWRGVGSRVILSLPIFRGGDQIVFGPPNQQEVKTDSGGNFSTKFEVQALVIKVAAFAKKDLSLTELQQTASFSPETKSEVYFQLILKPTGASISSPSPSPR